MFVLKYSGPRKRSRLRLVEDCHRWQASEYDHSQLQLFDIALKLVSTPGQAKDLDLSLSNLTLSPQVCRVKSLRVSRLVRKSGRS